MGNHLDGKSICQPHRIITSTYTICWVQLKTNYPLSNFTATYKNADPVSWMDCREITFGPLVPICMVASPTL